VVYEKFIVAKLTKLSNNLAFVRFFLYKKQQNGIRKRSIGIFFVIPADKIIFS
jgi:hypothetical protein